MNTQCGSNRPTARRALVAIAALLLAGTPGLASAQASDTRGELARALFPPVPTGTTIPIVGRRDTTRPLDPLHAIRPPRPDPATAELARKVAQEVAGWSRSIDYSGPRFGFTYLPQAAVDSLKNHKIDVPNTITQFGWQFEREIHVSPQGPRILNEWVFLAGGLESGVFLPSLTWLVGARDRAGNEIGVGPNASIAGVGLAAAAGVTIHDGGVNFPMNVAVARSKTGARISFLTGFTIH